jgi:hypothetical protein
VTCCGHLRDRRRLVASFDLIRRGDATAPRSRRSAGRARLFQPPARQDQTRVALLEQSLQTPHLAGTPGETLANVDNYPCWVRDCALGLDVGEQLEKLIGFWSGALRSSGSGLM